MPGLRRGRHTLHPDVLRTSLEIPPSGVSSAFSLSPALPVALTCVPHQAVGIRSSVFDSESRCKNSGQPPTARRIGVNVGTGQVRAPCGKNWTGFRRDYLMRQVGLHSRRHRPAGCWSLLCIASRLSLRTSEDSAVAVHGNQEIDIPREAGKERSGA